MPSTQSLSRISSLLVLIRRFLMPPASGTVNSFVETIFRKVAFCIATVAIAERSRAEE